MTEADLRADREWGRMLLERVAQGRLADVDRMLSNGEGVNEAVDADGDYALNLAARAGNAAMVRLLLRHGAYVDGSGANARRPLHDAAKSGSVETVRALVEAGSCAGRTLDGQQKLAAQYAAQSGSVALLELLANNGHLVHWADSEDATPLSWAVLERHYDAARFIARRGGDADDTLLFLCELQPKPERLEQVRFVLDVLEANPEEATEFGWRPAFAAAAGKSAEVLEIILAHHQTSQDTLNMTLAYLQRHGDPKLSQIALAHGADARILEIGERLPQDPVFWSVNVEDLRRRLNAELMAMEISAAMGDAQGDVKPASGGFSL